MINKVYQGYIARKRLGQNFLNDQLIIKNIISLINPQKSQAMVEIGPGLAALTELAAENLDELIVIEVDRNLVLRLQRHPFLRSKLIVYQQDAMTVNFSALADKLGKPLRLFGNLPYNISTPLIFHLFDHISAIADMHFMFQKELANRLIAKPNTKSYSRLSVMAQYFCSIVLILEVPSIAFTPSPKVNSAMVRLVPHKPIPYLVNDLYIFSHVTTEAFKQRRKMIRNSLANLFTTTVLEKLDINPTMRAENISVKQYCQLSNYISNNLS